jgi:hypothetical protein
LAGSSFFQSARSQALRRDLVVTSMLEQNCAMEQPASSTSPPAVSGQRSVAFASPSASSSAFPQGASVEVVVLVVVTTVVASVTSSLRSSADKARP